LARPTLVTGRIRFEARWSIDRHPSEFGIYETNRNFEKKLPQSFARYNRADLWLDPEGIRECPSFQNNTCSLTHRSVSPVGHP
jgi:hypothetical protein